MPEQHPTDPGQPPPAAPHPEDAHPDVRRERSDANVRAVVIFGLSLTGALVLVHLFLHWMFSGLVRRDDRQDPGLPAVAKKRMVFPADIKEIETKSDAPVLQRDAEYDLQLLRREEDARLNPKTPQEAVDAKTHTARIPIAEAMRRLEADAKLAAAQGLRFRAAPAKKTDGGKK